ncbi:uncharacterized protein FTOL_07767 [Fusarium torulosum]|uniref:Uncharacterized protein n=1 Tax=Fusarium torulosum TaxID=33205 RepID=A0AAE8MBC3_9HYPO|nr:uncharacterized protein FTOL_07767 [Fusarium torulosum]
MSDTELPTQDDDNAESMSLEFDEVPPFWIPPWLYTLTSVPPGSQPTKRQRQINNVQVWSLSILPIILIVCVAALAFWKKVDTRICSKIIKRKDPCVVEADPDIAGIGVRIATYTQTVCNILLLGFASDVDRTSSTYHAPILTYLATVLTLEVREYHQDEAATHADEDITYLQEDALFAAPPTLEIVDGAEECEFIGEGDDFECKIIGVRVVV